ncbi:MAG: DNA-processing protein DprA, partial [Nocardioides sp.]
MSAPEVARDSAADPEAGRAAAQAEPSSVRVHTGAEFATADDRLARITLSRLFEPGDIQVSRLVADLGAPRLLAELAAQPALRDRVADLGPRAERLDPERDLDNAARLGIRYVIPGDPEWPTQLDRLASCPPLSGRTGGVPLGLWVRGPARLDELARAVAIVGTRMSTTHGEMFARNLAFRAAEAGFAVISGGAIGIDWAAHVGALGGSGVTVAALACGADRFYPKTNSKLLSHIVKQGAIVSEVPLGCAPLKQRFLSRNRIIAGLARGTVVVEAAARSGALNTATWTTGIGRPVMSVPGPITSTVSEGAHELIRRGEATLVTQSQEVLELIGGAGEFLTTPPRAPTRPRDRLGERQRAVLDAVPV